MGFTTKQQLGLIAGSMKMTANGIAKKADSLEKGLGPKKRAELRQALAEDAANLSQMVEHLLATAEALPS